MIIACLFFIMCLQFISLCLQPIYFPKNDPTGTPLNVEEKKMKDRTYSGGPNRMSTDGPRNRDNGPRRGQGGPGSAPRGAGGNMGGGPGGANRPGSYNRGGPPQNRGPNNTYGPRR